MTDPGPGPPAEPTTEPNAGDQRWLTPGVAGISTASFLAMSATRFHRAAALPADLHPRRSRRHAGLIEGISDGLAGTARLAGGALADDPGGDAGSRSAATPPPPGRPR